MRDIVDTLGHEGMSSDESEPDSDDDESSSLVSTFRVKEMPWRRNITDELGIIDAERQLDKSVYSRQGSKPVYRRRGPGSPATTRGPVAGLPRAFYNDAWFETLNTEEKRLLRVNTREFSWVTVAAQRLAILFKSHEPTLT